MFIPGIVFATMTGTNYKIDYETITQGGQIESSSNYKMTESVGEVGEGAFSGTNYKGGRGWGFGLLANVPGQPTLTNPSNYYDRLSFVINNGGNPSDTLFAIAITPDNWTTTDYIQNDNTVGSTLGIEDYQTYTNWGGASGEDVTTLQEATDYKIKVRAMQGDFTETDWGPESAIASTTRPSITFTISANEAGFGILTSAAINTSETDLTITTNALSGYVITVKEDGNLRDGANEISDVGDSQIDAGSEEYGLATSKASQDFPQVNPCPASGGTDPILSGPITSSEKQVASASGEVSSDATTMCYAASITSTSAATYYSHIITYIATGTY